MRSQHIEQMVKRLGPVLKNRQKAEKILERYWSDKMAIVWEVQDVHRAANERELALTSREAIALLRDLHEHHNAQYGIKWEDIQTLIKERVLGRKLTQPEVRRFVHHDSLTIQR